MRQTDLLQPDRAGIAKAVAHLRQGDLVAFPTETVYGLGADACNPTAVAAIYATKNRPAFNPLIVHVSDIAQAARFAHFDATAQTLAAAHWPGPLSLILPLKKAHGLAGLVTAGLNTVAVRVPAHPLAQALLAAFDGPVAAPSANPSGRISPTRAAHVLKGLSGQIAAVLDGGPCDVGLESTIVAPGPLPRLLRAGGLATDQIEATIGRPLKAPDAARIESPGQMTSHYAPNACVRINAEHREPNEFRIGFGPYTGDVTLSQTGDLLEAAANLFDLLHIADKDGRPIAVAPIPETGLGQAINDRLRRASAPR